MKELKKKGIDERKEGRKEGKIGWKEQLKLLPLNHVTIAGGDA